MFSARFYYHVDQWINYLVPKKGHAVIISWNLSHNPVGRAFLFYDFLKRKYRTKLVGPIFKKFGKSIWRPLRHVPIDYDSFEAANFPQFLEQAKACVKKIEKADIIIICKPRLPSILLGLLLAEKTKAKVILDIDDYELAFFENQEPLTLEQALEQNLDLTDTYHETWTRICQSWIKNFPNRVVSNHKLQEKFGGTIIPHVRNERIFNPKLYNRSKIRKKYGYSDQDKVILFLGTPREHKGFEEIPKALKEIGNPNYKFCLIGKIRNDALRERFHQEYGDFAQIFNDSDFRDLPEKLMIADLICLLQDEDSLVSEYQLPAKLMDAIAMGIPILASPVGPLKSFCEQGLTYPILSNSELPSLIDKILIQDGKSKQQTQNRRMLLENLSYKSGAKELDVILNNEQNQDPNKLSKVIESIKELPNPDI